MSAAVPGDPRRRTQMRGLDNISERRVKENGCSSRRTVSPRVLRSCIPVLVIKAKGKQVPFYIEGDARRSVHCRGRKEVKSDDGG